MARVKSRAGHSDYPYLWGTPPAGGGDQVPTGGGDLELGIQRNICVTDFTKANGATRFKLGSHSANVGPPKEWGIWTDYMQPGHRAKHGLPYSGPDVDTIEAPAGSILLYDTRTWQGRRTFGSAASVIVSPPDPAYTLTLLSLDTTRLRLLHSQENDTHSHHPNDERWHQGNRQRHQGEQRKQAHQIVIPLEHAYEHA